MSDVQKFCVTLDQVVRVELVDRVFITGRRAEVECLAELLAACENCGAGRRTILTSWQRQPSATQHEPLQARHPAAFQIAIPWGGTVSLPSMSLPSFGARHDLLP